MTSFNDSWCCRQLSGSLLLQQQQADIYFDRNAFGDFDKCRGSYSYIFDRKIVRRLLGNFKGLVVVETFFIKVRGFKFETWFKKCFITSIFLGMVENLQSNVFHFFNPLQANVPFLLSQKTLQNQRFLNNFRRYRKGTLT